MVVASGDLMRTACKEAGIAAEANVLDGGDKLHRLVESSVRHDICAVALGLLLGGKQEKHETLKRGCLEQCLKLDSVRSLWIHRAHPVPL